MADKVLIFRIGSLGDTIVALPAFHLIARAYPNAERRVLTNLSPEGAVKEAPLPSVLGKTGLVHGYVSYPAGLGNKGSFGNLLGELKKWKPDTLVYLMPHRKTVQILRDRVFFELCSIRKMIGLNFSRAAYENRWLPEKGIFEPEAKRLLRNLSGIGEIDADDPANWDLKLTEEENSTAEKTLERMHGGGLFLACSIGTKQDVNDWGEDRWAELMQHLSDRYPELALVFIGASDEYQKSERVSRRWKGAKLNLCGKITPRVGAAIMRKAVLFVGHDSGPMHLAAAVGTRCVAVFSGKNKPGIWFPSGKTHKILYHETECSGCGLEACGTRGKKCIRSITAEEVLRSIIASYEAGPLPGDDNRAAAVS
jgi:lipopolysaccharide heptosyltransferase III